MIEIDDVTDTLGTEILPVDCIPSPASDGPIFTEPEVIGQPDRYDWEEQVMPDNCAVEAERAIINIFTRSPLSQQEAMYISSTHGWYMPGAGTSMVDVGNLLELHGIPTHTTYHATIHDLATELSMGHGIIVGVDSSELWASGPLAELKQAISGVTGIDFGEDGANHAVLVTGIDITAPNNPMVILNDSGVPDGQGVAYPMEKFMQAWEDSGFYYTATDIPLPENHIDGNLSEMNSIINSMSLFAGGFVGTFVGLETFSATGDIGTAVTTGITVAQNTTNLVEEFLSDEINIRNL